jgi:hypothetical protein
MGAADFESGEVLCIEDNLALAFQRLDNFRGIFRLHSDFFESIAKVFEKEVEVLMGHALIPGQGVGIANVLARIYPSTEEHGDEHNLPGAEMRHVSLRKEAAESFVLENFLIETLGRGLDGLLSADQVI